VPTHHCASVKLHTSNENIVKYRPVWWPAMQKYALSPTVHRATQAQTRALSMSTGS